MLSTRTAKATTPTQAAFHQRQRRLVEASLRVAPVRPVWRWDERTQSPYDATRHTR
jgi:hypothetical protein